MVSAKRDRERFAYTKIEQNKTLENEEKLDVDATNRTE